MRTAICIVLLLCSSLFIVSSCLSQQSFEIDSLSVAGIQLELWAGDKLGTASGFIVEKSAHSYLITNWHVVTGRHPKTGELMVPRQPDTIGVWLLLKARPGQSSTKWVRVKEPLYTSDSQSRWLEHPTGRRVDVVALPLDDLDSNLDIVTIDYDDTKTDVELRIAMPISIVGFPKGISGSGKFPIWKSGYIASEPDIDFEGLPAFLVDARTIEGMSGSPAFYRCYGSYLGRGAGAGYRVGRTGTRFVGIYSGRLPVDIADKATQSDIGIIWKPKVIHEILERVRN